MTNRFAIVGSRTTARRSARGTGISVFVVRGGEPWHQVAEYPTTNPSFLALDPHRPVLHAVHGDGTEISTLAIDPHTGALTLLGVQSTKGHQPRAPGVHPGRVLESSPITPAERSCRCPSCPTGPSSRSRGACTSTAPPGRTAATRPRRSRTVVFDPTGRFLLVPDKGLDTVFV